MSATRRQFLKGMLACSVIIAAGVPAASKQDRSSNLRQRDCPANSHDPMTGVVDVFIEIESIPADSSKMLSEHEDALVERLRGLTSTMSDCFIVYLWGEGTRPGVNDIKQVVMIHTALGKRLCDMFKDSDRPGLYEQRDSDPDVIRFKKMYESRSRA